MVKGRFSPGTCLQGTAPPVPGQMLTIVFRLQCLTTLDPEVPYGSISPDFKYIAIIQGPFHSLNIYDGSTGKFLIGTKTWGKRPKFTPDGCEVWCFDGDKSEGWAIVEGSESGLTKLESLVSTAHPPRLCLLQSPCGYKITSNGWVCSSRGKRLLWLPHHWRSYYDRDRVWSGQFLGLLHHKLPAAVILELEE